MNQINIQDLKASTGVGFGTSGMRDLVTKLTDKVVYLYTLAFVKHLKGIGDLEKSTIAIAGDLRSSTPRIKVAVTKAIRDSGLQVIDGGFVPTPAITYFGLVNKIPTVMVTGSHIPDDRNGVKFQLSTKEILKEDEQGIASQTVEFDENLFDAVGNFVDKFALEPINDGAKTSYIERYLKFFGTNMLEGKKVGLWGHSAVGRDIYVELLEKMGAKVQKIGYSEGVFVPIDTDAVNEETIVNMKQWFENYKLDFVISTDGDGDRPMLTDESGKLVRSELLPMFVAKFMGGEAVATTITACTVIEKTGWFKKVKRTEVGSPFIVAGIEELEKVGFKKVFGWELNGGFFADDLRTRDAVMSILGTIALAKKENKLVSMLVDDLPSRFTYSSSIKGIPTNKSLAVLENWDAHRVEIESTYGKIVDINLLDGLRLTFENEDIVHFRPSKNAPEFRDYTESDSYDKARVLSDKAVELISKWTT